MFHKPAHKNTEHPAGQIKTLDDYIKQVIREETPKKKLSFDEWWDTGGNVIGMYYKDTCKLVWDAAQENM